VVHKPQEGDWQPLSAFLAKHLPRSDPLRVGDFIGPHRLDFLFGELRRKELIEVRGRPGPLAKKVSVPPAEFYGWVLHEDAERIEHVHSGEALYDVEVRLVEAPVRLTLPTSRRGYRKEDEPLLDEMAKMIESGTARNANHAAEQIGKRGKIAGSGTLEYRIDRLARRYREREGELRGKR
jgi:hypothetical protein